MNEQLDILTSYLDTSKNEVSEFISNIDYKALNKAKELILNAEQKRNRVHVTGIGKPGHVAGYVASLLSSTGTPTYELNATEAVHGSAGQVREGDVVIAISNSGETKELKATIQTLKNNKASVISVCGNPNSWLAIQGDAFLFAGVQAEGDNLNKPPRSSILAEIIILQCLSVLLQEEKGLTLQQYVKWHPGGSLGESIREVIQKEGE